MQINTSDKLEVYEDKYSYEEKYSWDCESRETTQCAGAG